MINKQIKFLLRKRTLNNKSLEYMQTYKQQFQSIIQKQQKQLQILHNKLIQYQKKMIIIQTQYHNAQNQYQIHLNNLKKQIEQKNKENIYLQAALQRSQIEKYKENKIYSTISQFIYNPNNKSNKQDYNNFHNLQQINNNNNNNGKKSIINIDLYQSNQLLALYTQKINNIRHFLIKLIKMYEQQWRNQDKNSYVLIDLLSKIKEEVI